MVLRFDLWLVMFWFVCVGGFWFLGVCSWFVVTCCGWVLCCCEVCLLVLFRWCAEWCLPLIVLVR